jgi:hypothetical protein
MDARSPLAVRISSRKSSHTRDQLLKGYDRIAFFFSAHVLTALFSACVTSAAVNVGAENP